jgi:hypothetical protein
VIGKAEVLGDKDNPRFIVTNLSAEGFDDDQQSLRSARAGFTFGSLRHFRFSTSSHRHIALWQGWYPKRVKFTTSPTSPLSMGRPWPPSRRSLPGIDRNSGSHGATSDGKVAPINFWSGSGYELAL